MPHVRPDVYKAIAENDLGEVVFQDPFGDESRKAKRNLVGASFGALLIAALELQVNGFLGLQTVTGATLGGTITRGLACLIVLYFLAGFLLSAYVDYAAWKFKRERVLVKPYLDLVAMLESHIHATGEQVNNATRRLDGMEVDNEMRSQVAFQETIQSTRGQLTSIQENIGSIHEEFKPLVIHWAATVARFEKLSWRLRARFLSLWALDITVPIALSVLAIWKTHTGIPSIFLKIAA